MPKGGTLLLSTLSVELNAAYVAAYPEVREGRYVVLSVADSGCGMSADILSHLYEPFFTTKEEGQGTGLGLATVYGIVQRSGGHITATSEPGQGTTFYVYFSEIDEPAPQAEAPRAPTKPLTGNETVLFVEDEPVVRALARRTLEGYGYTVLEASDGLDALKIAQERQGPIDILVTDVIMPALGGIDLVERMIPLRPVIKVLFLSGYSADTIPGPSISFLPKPFGPLDLAKKVRETLDSPASSSR
jgi:two-component system cell cycle sensor histidine kinase/response regulator CckA